jgi:hypothetical protein
MSLVTTQGLQARRTLDERISAVEAELSARLNERDMSVAEAISAFPDDAEQTVREAVWRLLNSRDVEVRSGSQLHRRA